MNICRYFTTFSEDVSSLYHGADNTPQKKEWRNEAFASKIMGLIFVITGLFQQTMGILSLAEAFLPALAIAHGLCSLIAGTILFIIGHDFIIQGMNMSDYIRENNEITISMTSDLMFRGTWIMPSINEY